MSDFGYRLGKKKRTAPIRRRSPLDFERLEKRDVPAELTATGITLIDAFNQPLTEVVHGQQIRVRVDWSYSGFTVFDQYIARVLVDGVAQDTTTISTALPAGTRSQIFTGWYADPGPGPAAATHTIDLIVDRDNTVAEPLETDNSFSITFTTVDPTGPNALPSLLQRPLGKVPYQDWVVTDYIDVDPTTAGRFDFRGSSQVTGGQTGMVFGTYNFEAMDRGIPIYAAAAGTVVQDVDGNFDRQGFGSPFGINYVTLDHGNGWHTRYENLATDSITVKIGDTVKIGQVLGQMASSGIGSNPQMRFTTFFHGLPVETNYRPSAFWANPLPYAGDQPARVLKYGISAEPSGIAQASASEAITPTRSFSITDNATVTVYSEFANFKAGNGVIPADSLVFEFYSPANVLTLTQQAITVAQDTYLGIDGWFLNMSSFSSNPGTWTAVLTLNLVEVARIPFEITTTGEPALKLNDPNGRSLITNRTTPVDFGSVPLNSPPSPVRMSLQNYGGQPLTLFNPVIPPGFKLVGNLPAGVLPGASAEIVMNIDPSVVGEQFGEFSFQTNDPDVPVYRFNVKGTVTGTITGGRPTLVSTDSPTRYNFKSSPRLFAELTTLTDADSLNFDTGVLTAEVVSGDDGNDRLTIRSTGTGAGEIFVSGNTVQYGGTDIGIVTGGSNGVPLRIQLNADATVAATQALIRSFEFSNTSTTPIYQRRYLRISVSDETGKISNLEIYHIIPSGVERAPIIAAIPDQTISLGGNFTYHGTFTDALPFNGTATVDYSDGNGVQALTLNPDLSFDLGATYPTTQGDFPVTVTILNDEGGIAVRTFLVKVRGTKPTANVVLSPTNPKTKDLVTATVSASDVDSDPIQFIYVWKVGTTVVKTTPLNSSLTDTLDLSLVGNGNKGDVITVEVTPVDPFLTGDLKTASVTVQNSTPSVGVLINKLAPKTNEILVATVTGTDDDNDTLTYTYVWKVNGVVVPGAASNSFDLRVAGNGDKGDSISVEVTPNDGTANGTVGIASATVANSAPTATVTLSPNPFDSVSTVTATVTGSDDDHDTLTYTYVWKVNGAVKKTTANTSSTTDTFDLNIAGNGDRGDTIMVEVTPNDGMQPGSIARATRAVGDTPPSATVMLDSASPGTNQIVTATATKSDPDNDVVSLIFRWYVTPVGGIRTLVRTASSQGLTDALDLRQPGHGSRGDLIEVEVTPSDGFMDGASATASAVVGNTSPTATVFLSPSNPKTNDKLTAVATKADADLDSVNFTFVWKVNGITVQTTTPTGITDILDLGLVGNGNTGEVITVEVTPNDGTASGPMVSANATIVNSAPTATVSLNTTGPRTNDTVTATANKFSADGRTVTLTFVWKVNGGTVRTFTSATELTDSLDLSQSGNGNKGDKVSVEVTPTDGILTGVKAVASATVLNTAPVALGGGTASVNYLDTQGIDVMFSVNDIDGDPISIQFAAPPVGGSFAPFSGDLGHFTPHGQFVGDSTVTWFASDGTTRSSYQDFKLEITNNAISNLTLSSNKVLENSPENALVGVFSALAGESRDTVRYTLADDAGGRFKLVGNQLRVANASLLNFEATTTHKVHAVATDSAGTSVDAVFTINVTNVNESPVNTVPAKALTVIHDRPLKLSAVGSQLGVSDPDLVKTVGTLQVNLSATSGKWTLGGRAGLSNITGNGTGQLSMRGTPTALSTALRSLTFTPAPRFVGIVTATLVTSDRGNLGTGGVKTATSTFKIQVTNRVPTVPLAKGMPAVFEFSTKQNRKLNVAASAGLIRGKKDADGDAVSVRLVTGPRNGKLEFNATTGSLSYTPNQNFVGTETLFFLYSDGLGVSQRFQVTINVAK